MFYSSSGATVEPVVYEARSWMRKSGVAVYTNVDDYGDKEELAIIVVNWDLSAFCNIGCQCVGDLFTLF